MVNEMEEEPEGSEERATGSSSAPSIFLFWMALSLVHCGVSKEIEVQVVDPCNQEAVGTMDFLEFRPIGTGIDSDQLSTIESVDAKMLGRPLEVPLTTDFQIAIIGRRERFDAPIAGLGVSWTIDLFQASDPVRLMVPFGLINRFYRTTELADPRQCSFPVWGRYGTTATFIPESGRVLIVGGVDIEVQGGVTRPVYLRDVELYDPSTGRFDVAAELGVGGARAFHTASYLGGGRVLIAGGEALAEVTESLQTAFIIDAADPRNVRIGTRIFVMQEARTGHTATPLADGRVVIAGGRELMGPRPEDHGYSETLELYDPSEGTFTYLGDVNGNPLKMSAARFGHTASRLPPAAEGGPERVVIAGGTNGSNPVPFLDLVTIEPSSEGSTGHVVTASTGFSVGPIHHSATLVLDGVFEEGAVLFAGGYARIQDAEPQGGLPRNPLDRVEVWTLEEGALVRSCTASLVGPRGFHTAAIEGRRAVFVGGLGPTGQALDTAEVVELLPGASACFLTAPVVQTMEDPRSQHAMVPLASSGEFLVVGGRRQPSSEDLGMSVRGAEIFSPARAP